ncbi:MAG TPA: hypothetical protein VGP93_20735 [Polyangiaceae bacterium]|nr:hypothetical protein [Polyangiaceae bacterium]
MTSQRVRLGELLVASQIITRQQLEEMLEVQKTDGRRIGKLLVEAGLVTETQVTQILSQQLSVPWVSLYHIDFSRQLLDLVPRDLAEKYGLVPIFVRRVRGLGETLYVAMDDPSDESAQRDVSQWCGLPVRAMIAPPSDIRSAIRAYYGGGKDSASLSDAVAELEADEVSKRDESLPSIEVLIERSEASEDVAALEAASAELVAPPELAPIADVASEGNGALPKAHSQPPAVPKPPDSSPQVSAREVSMPAPPRKTSRMVTLTLLDGTQVNLPARARGTQPKGEEASPRSGGGDLTARDLVAALRAVSHGADASEILGKDEVHWQALFAALLSLLLKKHLIADWEFVEEFKKI